MSCRDWGEQVALYAGGDLAGSPAAEVERHLAECAGCQALLREVRESLAALRRAHAEEIPGSCYTALRARVMAEVERPRRPRWGWGWGYAAAAMAVIAGLAAVGLKREMRVEPLPAVALPPPAFNGSLAAAVPRQAAGFHGSPAVVAAARHIRRARPHYKQSRETILIKMETDNPDVVIYWIAETKGED